VRCASTNSRPRRLCLPSKNFRVDGIPAILLGIASIVTAASAGRVIEKAAPILPETLRETRELLRSLRPERKELAP
jgi:hypothetical protein